MLETYLSLTKISLISLFFSNSDAIMTVVIMVFVELTSFVIVILVGWVKTAVLIVAVMDTVTVQRALVFVTSVKVKGYRNKLSCKPEEIFLKTRLRGLQTWLKLSSN